MSMAVKLAESAKWKNMKVAMADLQDLLRCWTCNKVFTDPVSFQCGHFFCGKCAQDAGTKCGSCNVPSLASEIRPDRIVSAVLDCYKTLANIVQSEKENSSVSNVTIGGEKSSRSTVYGSDTPESNKDSSKSKSVDEKISPSGSAKEHVSNPAKSNCNDDILTNAPDKSLSYELLGSTNDKGFLKPSRMRKSCVKENKKTSSTRKKNGSVLVTKPSTSSDVMEGGAAVEKKLGRPRGRPPKKRSSSESIQFESRRSEGASDEELNSDNLVTPKKTRRSGAILSTSKNTDINVSVVKSTPRKSNTQGRDLSKKNHKGETPLHVACIKGNVDRIQTLLEANASPNTKDNAGWTPLHEAAIHGYSEVVKLLLGAGALVNVPGAGNVTPLHEAVSNNHIPIAKLLVAHGADIYARSSEGKTPFDFAVAEEMKQALCNTKQTGNHQQNLAEQEMVLCGASGLTAEEKKELSAIADNLNVTLLPVFGPDVTHFVVPSDSDETCSPSMDVLCAILTGVHILTRDWIKMSKNGVINHEIFELSGVTDFVDAEAPKHSRLNALKQLPGLFDGCHFYIMNNACCKLSSFLLTRANIITLVKVGGGTVLTRQPDPEAIPQSEQTVPYHAARDGSLAFTSHFILYSPGRGEPELKYNMKHCKTLSVEWFMNCIFNWKLLDS